MTPAAPQLSLWQPTFGALPDKGGTAFRVWSSAARSLALVVEDDDGVPRRRVPLDAAGDGIFEARIDDVSAGLLYRYEINGEARYPDPASRFQPAGVHGPSAVVDWTQFEWTDSRWRGVPFDNLVMYELHVGTFSPGGSFDGVIDRLPYLADLGVTAIELMPVAAFAGRWNWGYDGVAMFAPAAQYGQPADLQRLVDRAHRAGLAVLLDVVYNHLGPDGAYLSAFCPEFFSSRHRSPWGDSVNLDGPGSAMVRRFLIENALHWINEYHLDGLRLDATHALVDDSDVHFLAELSDAVRRLDLGRPVHLIAEDERNLAQLLHPSPSGGLGLDGVWADDFHHEVHRVLTGEREGYYEDYAGSAQAAATAINQGWTFTGQASRHAGRARGTDPSGIPLPRFVFCLQNHDQVGNRAFGERLHQLADLAACRAAAAVLLLAPETPLLFMGEEWAASTPFLYFTDHHDELGRAVTKGRRHEFERFLAFSTPGASERIPDPQDEATFAASQLRWDETTTEPHASVGRLYRALIGLRRQRTHGAASRARPDGYTSPAHVAWAPDADTLVFRRPVLAGQLIVCARLRGSGTVTLPAVAPATTHTVLTTEDHSFADDGMLPRVTRDGQSLVIQFARPSAVVILQAMTGSE